MRLSERSRRWMLTAHVACSVGWLGAVAAFAAVAVVGLTSDDPATARGAYLVMAPAAWYVLVPLALASLVTGVVQALATKWGLFRHYWVLFKLAINLVATIVLLLYTETFGALAAAARDPAADLGVVRSASPLLHAVAALVLLLAATILAVVKPTGVTPFGRGGLAGT